MNVRLVVRMSPKIKRFNSKVKFQHQLLPIKLFFQVGNQPMVKEVDFIRLHLGPLAESVQDNANAWVTSLGKQIGTNSLLSSKN